MKHNNSFPDLICYLVTSKCVANCDICISGVDIPDLSTEDAKKVISKIYEAGAKMISFAGREPFMRKDIFELIEYTKCIGAHLNIETTGALLDEYVFKKLSKYHVDMLSISVDSLDERLCKNMGRFFLNKEQLNRIIDNCKRYNMKLKINSVVSQVTKDEIGKVGEFLNQNKPSIWKLRQFTPRSSGYSVRKKYEISEEDFLEIVKTMKKSFPLIKIEGKTSVQQSGTAFMVFPDGQIAKPDGKGHILYGSILEQDAKKVWLEHFSQDKKEQHHKNYETTYL